MSELKFSPAQLLRLLNIDYPTDDEGNPLKARIYIKCPWCGRKKLNYVLLGEKAHLFRCAYCNHAGNSITLYKEFAEEESDDTYNQILEAIKENKIVKTKSDSEYSAPRTVTTSLAPLYNRNLFGLRMLSLLKLEDYHKKALYQRGLPAEVIRRNGYRTINVKNAIEQRYLANRLINLGVEPKGIPWFYQDDDNQWMVGRTCPGMIIPYLDKNAMIQGFQVRSDNADKGTKYWWLSSTDKKMGVSCPTYVHYATDFTSFNKKYLADIKDTIFITEGALKGDIAHYYTGFNFLCVSGVNSLGTLSTELDAWTGKAKNVVICYDMDCLNNEHVRSAEMTLKKMAEEKGFKVFKLMWNSDYKGIDDYCLSNKGKFNIKPYPNNNSVLYCYERDK